MAIIPLGLRPRCWMARVRGVLRHGGMHALSRPRGLAPHPERLESRLAPAIAFRFDTSFDTSGFFASNPAAMTVLQQAGQILGSSLHDSLAAISPAGVNSWTATFLNPANPGLHAQVANLSVPADTLVVYVGGAALGGSERSLASQGSESSSGTIAWNNLVAARGQTRALATPPTDVGPWGGSIAFDTSTSWSFAG